MYDHKPWDELICLLLPAANYSDQVQMLQPHFNDPKYPAHALSNCCKNPRCGSEKMPFLRSQARASSDSSSTNSVEVNSLEPSMSTKPHVSTNFTSSVSTTANSGTMFPFPPAPVLPTKSRTKPSCDIVNISNVSSEASLVSDASSLSLHSAAASYTASPNSED